jgi:8-oxo-dGTP pyrophosphatase MutT (NUDIX family)
MRTCSRAIVIKDDQLLVMERFKLGKTYYTLLGGSVEAGEDTATAALREVREESGLSVNNPRLVFIEEAGDPFGDQYVYLCDYESGEPILPPDSEEAFWSKPGTNTYTPMWLPVDQLKEKPFVSPLLKEALLMALEHGWPKETYRFSSKHSQRLS